MWIQPLNLPRPSSLSPIRTQAPNRNPDLPESQSQSHPSSTTAPDPDPAAAALSDLQAQLHDTHTSLASHVDEMRVLEGVFAEHDAIQRVAGVLRVLVEKITEAAGGENGGGGGW